MKRTIVRMVIFILTVACIAGGLAQSQNSVGGGANGANVNVTATILGLGANVSVPSVAPVTLPPQGGSFNNQVASVDVGLGVPRVLTVLSTGLIENTTAGNVSSSSAHSESSSTVHNLNVLNGLVTATTIRSKSTSDGNGSSATSTDAGTFANQLTVAGVLYQQSEFVPNTTVAVNASISAIINGLPVNIPVNGTVVINEQIPGGNGATSSSLTVNFLHVNVSGSVAGLITLNANIVVASATSIVNFTAGPPPANNPPVLNVPGPQSVQVGNTLTFDVSASDPDAGDTVTLAASNVPSNASFTQTSGNPANGRFSFTPSQSQAGQTFTVNFTATDSRGASASRQVQITVLSPDPPPQNRPPVISVPGPQLVQVGSTLSFTVTASDPDGDAVTLSASNLPPNSSFNPGTGVFTFTPVDSQAGQVVVPTFTATDARGASASASVQITVVLQSGGDDPGPPIISVPPSPIILPVGDTLEFTVTGVSPVLGCTVQLSASGVPDNASFVASTGQFRFVPQPPQRDRSFLVSFIATDCRNKTATGAVMILVVGNDGGGGGGGGGGVEGPGRICVPVNKIFFNTLPANSGCGFITVSIMNTGTGVLRINSLGFTDGTQYRVEGVSNLPLTLQSAGVIQLRVFFEPKRKGTLTDRLVINTNDSTQPTITMELKGKGR